MNMRAVAGRNSPIILAQSGVASSVTGTTAETTLASIVIPGGLMGPNGRIRIVHLWEFTNSANAKALRIRFGGLTGNIFYSVGPTTTNSNQGFTVICNQGSLTSQVGMAAPRDTGLGSIATAVNLGIIDTSVDQTLVLTGMLALASEAISLRSYSVEVLPG